jgi:hypothetical protein
LIHRIRNRQTACLTCPSDVLRITTADDMFSQHEIKLIHELILTQLAVLTSAEGAGYPLSSVSHPQIDTCSFLGGSGLMEWAPCLGAWGWTEETMARHPRPATRDMSNCTHPTQVRCHKSSAKTNLFFADTTRDGRSIIRDRSESALPHRKPQGICAAQEPEDR